MIGLKLWLLRKDCINLIADRDEQGDDRIEELKYQIDILNVKKKKFLSLEGEIERKLNTIEIKNVTPAEIDTSQDGRVLTPGDLVGSEPTSSLTAKLDAAHAKEETKST